MDNQMILKQIVDLVGGPENIASATNCITRLRWKIKDESKVQKTELGKMKAVLGIVEDETLQIVVGPGKAPKLMAIYNELYGNETSSESSRDNKWQENKQALKGKQKQSRLKDGLRVIGEIFIPLLPAIIAAGIFNGIAGLLTNLMNTGNLPQTEGLVVLKLVLSLLGGAFLSYFTIFTGISAAKKFGATEALGGMVGAMTVMGQINDISTSLGMYNTESPLNSILRSGKGGVIGVILGVYILSRVERAVRKKMPDVLDLMFTPVLSLIIMVAAMLFVIMPITGILSDWLVKALELLVYSDVPAVNILSGFVLSALFLPMVLLGLHHGLIPIYAVQLEAFGGVALFPVLAMAGAGQVGAAIAIYIKAKRNHNHNLVQIISGALPAGFLGIGEPLIYGVTLPLGKPFITAGIGAGFGGAYVMLQKVMANAWGPSGLTAIPLMQPDSMIHYFIGLVVSYIGGFVVTTLIIKDADVQSTNNESLNMTMAS